MPATRTDVHRPAVLVTEDYAFVAVWDREGPTPPLMGSAAAWAAYEQAMEYRRNIWAAIRAAAANGFGELYGDRGTHQCHHCGARLRYSAALQHQPTRTVIFVGETCMDNRFERSTAEFQAARRAGELDREAKRIRDAVTEWTTANPDLAWLVTTPLDEIPNSFVADVARKLRTYGSISERQAAAVQSAVARDAATAARRLAESHEVKVPCPEGRYVITGEVYSTKWQSSDYGDTLKMGVKDDRGFKVWMTCPSSLSVERGDRVEVTATVQASDNDEAFGFGSRPAKARVLAEAA
jgi:hypothetical protein